MPVTQNTDADRFQSSSSPRRPLAGSLKDFIFHIVRVGRIGLTALAASVVIGSVQADETPRAVPKMVFAHFMVCCPAAGTDATIQDFARDIAAARAGGIQGFALNVAAQEPYYLKASRLIFKAAEQSDPTFKLFFSFDASPVDSSAAMLTELTASPAYLRVDGRPVVSTYGGAPEWGTQLVARLATSGLKPFLVPNYQRLSDRIWAKTYGRPTVAFLDELYQNHPEVDGYFQFGPDLGYPGPPTDGPMVAERSKLAHKISMMGISPYYRGLGVNYRLFESGGFQGMAAQWTAAIESDVDWVELVTWNDWGESTYLAPYGDIRQQNLWNYHWGPLLSHEDFLKASRYFIDWFTTAQRPTIERPSIYYFYRLHPKSAYGIVSVDTKEQGRPKGWEEIVDGIYVTAFLPYPLTIDLVAGSSRQSVTLPAGVQHHRFDFVEGAMSLQITDQGRSLAEKDLEFPTTKSGQVGNFNYFSGEVPLP